VLPAALAKELRRFEKRFGSVNYARFGMGESKVIQSRSPLPESELAAKNDAELIHYLNTWEPPKERSTTDWWIETNVAGLSEQFVKLIGQQPDRFQNWPGWWRELKRPIFLRRFIERASDAVKTKASAEWSLWIEVAN
jgi:hypothetical protein